MTDEDAILAGELALGLLDGEEKAAALRLVLADPAFARAVERWRERFGALNADVPDAAPGAQVENLVMRANDRPPNHDSKWRWIAAVTGIAAAVLLMVPVMRPTQSPAPPLAVSTSPVLVATLKSDHGEAFSAVYDPATRQVRFGGAVSTPTHRDLELWAIGADGVPHAAGLLPRDAAGHVTPASEVAIAAGTTLAISIEPIGGSPKPTPTGPVIATGKLVAI